MDCSSDRATREQHLLPDDIHRLRSLPQDRESLEAILRSLILEPDQHKQQAEEQKQRAEELHLQNLRLQVELERYKKWRSGPCADRLASSGDVAQILLEFAEQLEAKPIQPAVRTRVIAVIEYNYERDGQIIVPAGTEAIGNIEQADRSGYVSIRFGALQMPDGSKSAIDAVALDLNSQVLKGRVTGKNTGKSLLARSFSGIGQGAVLLVGRGNLNQPLSEQDLMWERVGENIGLASDEQVARLALTQHVVVSVSAGTPIYVVLEDSVRPPRGSDILVRNDQSSKSPRTQELRELLQLQRELNETAASGR